MVDFMRFLEFCSSVSSRETNSQLNKRPTTASPSANCVSFGLGGLATEIRFNLVQRGNVLKELDEIAATIFKDGQGDRSHGGGLLMKDHTSARHAFVSIIGTPDRELRERNASFANRLLEGPASGKVRRRLQQ